MKKLTLIATLFVLAFLSVSCKSYYESLLASNDYDAKFKAAMKYYEEGKYRKASAVFESLLLVMQGTPQEDSVQFFNAMSNYKWGVYDQAEANFAKFLEVFPRSPFAEEARFLRIKCLYNATYRWELDQVPTQRAMAIISEFMYDNPTSQYYPICDAMLDEFRERLDRKSYEAAKIYYDMKDYKASRYALKNVLKDNADNRYREQILFYTAMSSYKFAYNSVRDKQKERYMTFIDDYYNFVGEYPEVRERKELDSYFIRAQKLVGMEVGLDSAQVAAAAELAALEGVTKRDAQKIKADRRNARKAIRQAKRAVEQAERENEVARKVNAVKNTASQEQKEKERAAKAESMRIYKEAKAKAKAEAKAAREAEKAARKKAAETSE